jgi:hypothetical protein
MEKKRRLMNDETISKDYRKFLKDCSELMRLYFKQCKMTAIEYDNKFSSEQHPSKTRIDRY